MESSVVLLLYLSGRARFTLCFVFFSIRPLALSRMIPVVVSSNVKSQKISNVSSMKNQSSTRIANQYIPVPSTDESDVQSSSYLTTGMIHTLNSNHDTSILHFHISPSQ